MQQGDEVLTSRGTKSVSRDWKPAGNTANVEAGAWSWKA